jgi:hypothetical protein
VRAAAIEAISDWQPSLVIVGRLSAP